MTADEVDPAQEIERLRLENERLAAQLSVERPTRQRLRRGAAGVLAFLTALLLVVSVVANWTDNTALDTDKFVARVGPVIDEPEVRAAISEQLGDQLINILDIQERLTPALPTNLRFLAGPVVSGVEDFIQQRVARVVDSDRFRQVWDLALASSHEEVVQTLKGSNSKTRIVNGKVYVDLVGVIDLVLQNLQSQLPDIFGSAVSLKLSENLPVDQIRAIVSRYLGKDLPETFASVPVIDADALDQAHKGITIFNAGVVLVLIVALVCLVLALWASVSRRRTLLQLGLWTAGISALLFFVVRAVVRSTIAGIGDDTLRPAVSVASRVIFSSLREWGAVLFFTGLALAIVAYLVGPGEGPRRLRAGAVGSGRWLADRGSTAVADDGIQTWVAANRDPLRVGGVIVAAILLVIWTSWTALLVVGALLVIFEVAVTLTTRDDVTPAADGPSPPQTPQA